MTKAAGITLLLGGLVVGSIWHTVVRDFMASRSVSLGVLPSILILTGPVLLAGVGALCAFSKTHYGWAVAGAGCLAVAGIVLAVGFALLAKAPSLLFLPGLAFAAPGAAALLLLMRARSEFGAK